MFWIATPRTLPLWQRRFFGKVLVVSTLVGFLEKRYRENLSSSGLDQMTASTWVLESDIFPDSHLPLRAAIRDAGHRLVDWDDAWWIDGIPKNIGRANTFFHGSLGNASRIHAELGWSPGSYCDASAFCCSAWYDSAREWLLHSDWRFLPANTFVDTVTDVAAALGCTDRIFVRPDSPLKPFSGRVLDLADISLAKLDHGFYFDDESLPCLLYTSPSPRDATLSRMPSSA